MSHPLKLIALVGPTASGKTDLGIALAREFSGIIISADSRQIYREMNIGTGKPALQKAPDFCGEPCFEVDGVRHVFFDIVNPDHIFTVAEYKDRVYSFLERLRFEEPNILPFLVGGTGLYVSAVLENWTIPKVAPTTARALLEARELSDLVAELQKKAPDVVTRVDIKNKRRVVRALEVVLEGKNFDHAHGPKMFDSLVLGVSLPRPDLYARIEKRVDMMMAAGLLGEVQNLIAKYGWNARALDGIGYRQFRPYFEKKIPLEAAVEQLKKDTRNYAKRQLTWWKKRGVVWIKNFEHAKLSVESHLKNK